MPNRYLSDVIGTLNSELVVGNKGDGSVSLYRFYNGAETPAATSMSMPDADGFLEPVDGETAGALWVPRACPVATWRSVVFGGDLFVAVGDAGAIMTSPDGVLWTSRSSGTSENLQGISYGNSLFVAVGTNSTILTSPDGVSWTPRTSPIASANLVTSFWAMAGFFLALIRGGTDILRSVDGVTWTSHNQVTTITADNGAIWDSTSVGSVCLAAAQYRYSTDGQTWLTTGSMPFSTPCGAAQGYQGAVIINRGSSRLASQRTLGSAPAIVATSPTESYQAVAYGGGSFVAAISDPGGSWAGYCVYTCGSIEGTWVRRYTGSITPSTVCYGNGRFVLLCSAGSVRCLTSGFLINPPTR